MDPLSALGVASNVVQLVGFAWTVVSETNRLAKSASGLSADNETLEKIAADTIRLNNAIVVSDNISPELATLAAEAKDVAARLQSLIEELRLSKKSRWRALAAVSKDAWAKDKTDALSQTLMRLQTQITAHIQYLLLWVVLAGA